MRFARVCLFGCWRAMRCRPSASLDCDALDCVGFVSDAGADVGVEGLDGLDLAAHGERLAGCVMW